MRLLILAGVTAACWDSWLWFVRRIWSSPEEGIALAAAALLIVTTAQIDGRRRTSALGSFELAVMAGLVLLHGASGPLAPAIVRAGLAALAALYTLYRVSGSAGRRTPPALWILGLLATPIVPTLQFYLGYPMRIASAAASVILLRMNGIGVTREGTYLAWRGELIQFDAPCSGVSMLWAGLLLVSMAGFLYRLSPARLLASLAGCSLLLIAANVLRSTSLFHLEAGLIDSRVPWLHEAAGLASFAGAAAGILWLASRLRLPDEPTAASPPAHATGPAPALPVLAACCVLSALGPAAEKGWAAPGKVQAGAVAWPVSYNGMPLTQVPLDPRDAAFTADFPGHVGRFSDGRREIVIRWVTSATRKLHPASDCFRGLGYSITPVPMRRNSAGKAMSCFEARGRGGALRVCEHLEGSAGKTWPDVGAWYWDAAFDRSAQGWWSYVVAERI